MSVRKYLQKKYRGYTSVPREFVRTEIQLDHREYKEMCKSSAMAGCGEIGIRPFINICCDALIEGEEFDPNVKG